LFTPFQYGGRSVTRTRDVIGMSDVKFLTAELNQAIVDWRGELHLTQERLLTPGQVLSAIANIRLEAMMFDVTDLPVALYQLYLDASLKVSKGLRDSLEFNVSGLERVAENAQAEVQVPSNV
jgi:hypothetical protein